MTSVASPALDLDGGPARGALPGPPHSGDGVLLFNPLPVALAHYEREMIETLERIGLAALPVAPLPPTDWRDASLLARAGAHLTGARAAGRSDAPSLVLWPAFGWLDPLLWSRCARGARVIVHDPIPIRQLRGYGRVARRAARAVVDRGDVELVYHTQTAARAGGSSLGTRRPGAIALHPILTTATAVRGAHDDTTRTILVAGQHKPTRDTTLLATLGPLLRAAGYRPRIVGLGWPALPGWEHVDEFVSEQRLADEIAHAAAVLVPYHRYWQSNIAVRAIESNVPVVGGDTEFLLSLYGREYPGLCGQAGDADEWLAAIDAVTARPDALDDVRTAYRERVDASWRQTLSTPPESP